MLNAHVAQQLTTLFAPRGGEDLGSDCTGDRDGRLSDAACRGVNQHAITAADSRQIVQAVQAVAWAVVVAAASPSVRPSGNLTARLASQVTKVLQHPLPERPPTRSPTLWSLTPGPTAVTTPAKSVPNCGSRPSKVGYRPNAMRTSAKLMLDADT